jgi:hypothetical protein
MNGVTTWLAIMALLVGYAWSLWKLGRAGWPEHRPAVATDDTRDRKAGPDQGYRSIYRVRVTHGGVGTVREAMGKRA